MPVDSAIDQAKRAKQVPACEGRKEGVQRLSVALRAAQPHVRFARIAGLQD
jgi:hypothetical protein